MKSKNADHVHTKGSIPLQELGGGKAYRIYCSLSKTDNLTPTPYSIKLKNQLKKGILGGKSLYIWLRSDWCILHITEYSPISLSSTHNLTLTCRRRPSKSSPSSPLNAQTDLNYVSNKPHTYSRKYMFIHTPTYINY